MGCGRTAEGKALSPSKPPSHVTHFWAESIRLQHVGITSLELAGVAQIIASSTSVCLCSTWSRSPHHSGSYYRRRTLEEGKTSFLRWFPKGGSTFRDQRCESSIMDLLNLKISNLLSRREILSVKQTFPL